MNPLSIPEVISAVLDFIRDSETLQNMNGVCRSWHLQVRGRLPFKLYRDGCLDIPRSYLEGGTLSQLWQWDHRLLMEVRLRRVERLDIDLTGMEELSDWIRVPGNRLPQVDMWAIGPHDISSPEPVGPLLVRLVRELGIKRIYYTQIWRRLTRERDDQVLDQLPTFDVIEEAPDEAVYPGSWRMTPLRPVPGDASLPLRIRTRKHVIRCGDDLKWGSYRIPAEEVLLRMEEIEWHILPSLKDRKTALDLRRTNIRRIFVRNPVQRSLFLGIYTGSRNTHVDIQGLSIWHIHSDWERP